MQGHAFTIHAIARTALSASSARWRALCRLIVTSTIWHSRTRLGVSSALGWICRRVRTTGTTHSRSNLQQNSSTSLKCIQLNARSLNNKFLSFHNLIYSYSYDIIAITESWWRPNITDGFIDPTNKYNSFRHDRVGRQAGGGGVCILTVMCLNVVQVQFTANIEAVCLDINVCSSIYRFIAAYRPPGAISNDVNYNYLLLLFIIYFVLKVQVMNRLNERIDHN